MTTVSDAPGVQSSIADGDFSLSFRYKREIVYVYHAMRRKRVCFEQQCNILFFLAFSPYTLANAIYMIRDLENPRVQSYDRFCSDFSKTPENDAFIF